MDRRHAGRETQHAYKSMRDVQGGRVRQNAQMYKPLTKNIWADCLVWYFNLRIIPGTSHTLRSFWAGPYRVLRLIASALAEIKPVYYPEEEKLVILDNLKLYGGEDVIWQDPEDIDPDQWLDKGELTELPEAPLGETEKRSWEPSVDRRDLKIPPEPELKIQVIPEDPEEIAVRDGIQVEIHHEDNKAEATMEGMLEVPLELNEVPDLMMEEEDVWPAIKGSTKWKIDEEAQGVEKTAGRRWYPPWEMCTFPHSVSEDTKSRGILFWRLEWSTAGRRQMAEAR